MALLDVYQDSRNSSRCRSCGKPIEWAVLVKSGKRMPFDAGVVVVRSQHELIGGRIIETVDTGITKSHFETCPDAAAWRQKRK